MIVYLQISWTLYKHGKCDDEEVYEVSVRRLKTVARIEKLTLEGSFKLYTYIVWFYSLVIDLMNVIYW